MEESQYYSDYEELIDSIFVETINEDGLITIAYFLGDVENENKTLVFIGNQDFDFVQILEIDMTENTITVNDLLLNIKTRAHQGYCTENACVKTTNVSYNPAPGCSTIVGQSCRVLTAIPMYGFYLNFLCRGGVFVACNIDFSKKCTQWETYEYECSIP